MSLLLSRLEGEIRKEDNIEKIKHLLLNAFGYIEKEKVKHMLFKNTTSLIQSIDTKTVFHKIINQTLDKKYDEKIYDTLVTLVEKKAMEESTREKITAFIIASMEKKAESSFFKMALKPLVSVGKEKLSSIVDKTIVDLLTDLKDSNSSNRKNILMYIQNELVGLRGNEQIILQLEEKRNHYLNGDSFEELNEQIINKAFVKVEDIIQTDAFLTEKVIPFIESIMSKLKNDEKTMSQMESSIKNALGNLIENNHDKIGKLIKSNLDKLSNEQLTDMMENKIGKELSWIRVNGSICGFLIGIILSIIKILA